MSPTTMPAFDQVSTPHYQTSPAWTELDEAEEGVWIESVLGKVARFERLRTNWDSYGSGPATREAIQCAAQLLLMAWQYLGRSRAPEVVPIGGGGIQLAFMNGRRSIEVEVLPNGDLLALKLEDDEPDGDDLSLGAVREDLEGVLGWL